MSAHKVQVPYGVWHMATADATMPRAERIADAYADGGANHVAVMINPEHRPSRWGQWFSWEIHELAAFARILRARGIDMWVTFWPRAELPRSEWPAMVSWIQRMVAFVECAGVEVDCEVGWERGHPDVRREMAALIVGAIRSADLVRPEPCRVGVSYMLHLPRAADEEWLGADVHAPQAYSCNQPDQGWSERRNAPGDAQLKAWRDWERRGKPGELVMGLAAFKQRFPSLSLEHAVRTPLAVCREVAHCDARYWAGGWLRGDPELWALVQRHTQSSEPQS